MKIYSGKTDLLRCHTWHSCLVFALLFMLLAPISSQAGIVADTGPGTYSSNGGTALYNYRDYQFLADSFTVTENTVITGINGWIGTFTGGGLNIGLAQNSSGVPGLSLFSQSLFVAGQTPTTWKGVSGLEWGITPGTYWVTFTPAVNSFEGFMTYAPSNPLFRSAYNSSGNHGSWLSQPEVLGFQVFGDPGISPPPPPMQPAPEPSTYGLMGGLGLCALIVRKIRKFRRPTNAEAC